VRLLVEFEADIVHEMCERKGAAHSDRQFGDFGRHFFRHWAQVALAALGKYAHNMKGAEAL